MRLILLAGFLSGLEIFIPLINGLFNIPQGLFVGLSALTTMGAFIGRIIAQKESPPGSPGRRLYTSINTTAAGK